MLVHSTSEFCKGGNRIMIIDSKREGEEMSLVGNSFLQCVGFYFILLAGKVRHNSVVTCTFCLYLQYYRGLVTG